MTIGRANGKVVNVLLIALVIAGAGLVYYVISTQAASPATITPSLSAIGVGQTASITVSWPGNVGNVPYTVYLYQGSSSSSCGTSSFLYNAKTPLPTAAFTFSVSPTTTTYYCGTVQGSKGSSAVSAIVTVIVKPLLTDASVAVSPTASDSGQSVTLAATVKWAGGDPPYTVTLYSGSNSTCTSDTQKASVISGSNPLAGLVKNSTIFSVKDPLSVTYYCATITDSATVPHSVTSSTTEFIVNPALSAVITPASPAVDSGSSITLVAVPAQGTPPYSYQWYTGSDCSPGAQIKGETSSSLPTGPLTSTLAYSVHVTDSSGGSPPASVCASMSGKINPALAGTSVTVSPSGVVLDAGQSMGFTVSWTSVGTPPYTAQLYTSSTPDCQKPVATGSPSTSNGTSATFTISPPSTAYYCASVEDSAAVPQNTTSSAGALVTVNSALVPTVSLSPSAIDTGQTATITAKVTWTGGTSPYSITLYSGSSTTCTSDTTTVATLSGANPQTGVSPVTFTFTAPTSTTEYCASVKDKATTPNVASSSAAQFTVNQALAASISPAAPVIDNGSSITLSAVAIHGTSPYSYQWYTGLTCAAGSAISGQTASPYSTGMIKSTSSFSVSITDGSVGTPPAHSCAGVTVIVNHALDPRISLSLSSIDAGQTPTVTATVTWTGGTSPYSVTLLKGSSSTCSLDTTVVTVLTSSGPNPHTGITGTSAIFTFTAPTSTTEYCASVTDSATVQVTADSPVLLITVNPALKTPSLSLSLSTIDAGQTPTVNATVSWSGGTSPYALTLYSGSSATCASDTSVVTPLSGTNPEKGLTGSSASLLFTAPGSTTYYCASLTDGAATPLTASSSTTALTVNPALSVSAPVLSLTAFDSGQSATVTATVTWSGGTSPYTVTLYSGPSSSCASDTTVVEFPTSPNPETGVTVDTGTFTFTSPATTTYYCAKVTDSSGIPFTMASSTSPLTINPPLSASLPLVSPPAIDAGQTATVTVTVTWSGGTSPFTVALFSGLTPSCSSATALGSPKTNLLVTSTTFTFASPTTTTFYCAKVTDSSGVPSTYTTSLVQFTVNPPPTVTISPPAPSVAAGHSTTLTALVSGGSPPYTYLWYTGPSCKTSILGQTSATYTTGVVTATSTYSVEVTDSSTGSPSSISSACASATVTVGSGPEGVASNPTTGMVYVADPGSNQISVIDSYSNTVVTTINVGTLPWGIAVNSASNIIYVTNYGSNTVTVIDGYTNAVTATIGVGTQPEGIALSPSLDEAYVANSGSNTVSVIDTTTDAVIATVAVGNVPQSIAVGPTPYTVFVTDYGSNTISVISVAAPYPSFSVTIVTVGGNPWGVAVSQLNDDVYVTNSGSGTVSVLNSLTYATVATITVGGTPQGIEIDGATATAYVADGATNTVLAINTATNTLITSTSPPIPIPVGSDPWGISILLNPGNVLYPNLGYVTNSGSNVVTVINFASNNVLAMVVAVPSTVSASISPATPSIDSGQSITLTAVPPQGTSQLYQWYTGPSCSNEILGQTASNFTTGALTSTTSYSVLVHDSVTPPGGVCASATVNVNAAFEGSAVTISPSPITIDSGQSVTLTVTWTNAGTSPYSVLLTTSTSASCTNPTSTGTLEIGLAGTSTTFTVVPPSTTYYCATATDSAYSPESSSTTSAAVVTVNPELGTPTLALSPSVIDSGQSATITATVTWSGGTSPYTVTLYSDTSSTCPSGATVVSTETDVAGTSTTFSLAAPSSTTYTYYCASVTDSATTQATVYSTVIVFTVNPALTAIVSPSAPTIDSGQSITLTATPSGGTPPYRYQWYTGPGCASTSPISGQTSSSYVTAALKSGALYSVLVTDSSSASVCASAAVAVSPALTAPTISVTPSSMSSPGSSTLSTTTSFSGGTSTYTCQWLVEAPGGSSFTDLGSSFSCTVSSLPTYSTGTLTVGTWEFELEVTDSSAVPNTVTSSPVSVTVS